MIEAQKALRSSSWNSAAAMARRAVQATTRHLGAKPSSLKLEINGLADKGLLTQALQEWAHHVRALGNAGAHPDDIDPDVTETDARDAVNFAQFFLIYTLTLPAEIAAKRKPEE